MRMYVSGDVMLFVAVVDYCYSVCLLCSIYW